MPYMFRTAIATIVMTLPLLGSGCSATPHTDTFYTYRVQIHSSELHADERIATLTQETLSMKDLLDEIGLKRETRLQENTEVIRSLNGVISTKSKSWQLYINNTRTPLTTLSQMPVHASDTIEWKYESQ